MKNGKSAAGIWGKWKNLVKSVKNGKIWVKIWNYFENIFGKMENFG